MFLSKLSWDLSNKNECNDLVNKWKMMFQVSDLKRKNFLDLIDSNNNLLEPLYIKDGLWLQNFGHSNSLCMRASRAITNYVLIGKYRLRFFLNEEFKCPCGQYSIKSRCYILYEYKRFNKYWNLRRDSIAHFVMFLDYNPNAFAFSNDIT